MSGNRSFRIVAVSHDDGINFDQGVYHGSRPNQAALKAFNWYCRKANLKNCSRRFTIEEITRGSPHKKYKYIGTRQMRQIPKKIEREGGKPFIVKYDTVVLKD